MRSTRRFLKRNLSKKKGSKGLRSWNHRYVCVYFNYLLIFNPGRSKNGTPEDIIPKNVIRLEAVANGEEIDRVEKEKGWVFKIPIAGKNGENKLYFFQVENENDFNEWIKVLRTTVKVLKEALPKVSEEEMGRNLVEVKKVFPEKTFRVGRMIEEADKFLGDMKKYREEYRKWSPIIFSICVYAEYQLPKYQTYFTWFTSETIGVWEIINKGEEDQLKSWEDTILGASSLFTGATQTMFFLEDLQPFVEKGENILKLVDTYNEYVRETGLKRGSDYSKEKLEITEWVKRLKSYPFSKDISLIGFETGKIVSTNEVWSYDHLTFTLRRDSVITLDDFENRQVFEFSSKDQHFQFVDKVFGIVIWNNKSIVWLHPRCPFVIRYDYYAAKGVFRQYTQPPLDKKAAPAPPLSDWQIVGGTIRAVTVGERNPAPPIPAVTEYKLTGKMPPPAILIPCLIPAIKAVVYKIYGWA